jgi:hypothetical protein
MVPGNEGLRVEEKVQGSSLAPRARVVESDAIASVHRQFVLPLKKFLDMYLNIFELVQNILYRGISAKGNKHLASLFSANNFLSTP